MDAPRSSSFICPECGGAFILKGSKLRKWNFSLKVKADKKGPFCNYVCSRKWVGKFLRKK